MRKFTLILCGLTIVTAGSIGQVFKISLNQPDALVIEVGNDTTICPGHEVMLGGTPTASGGTDGYLFMWSPADGLDNPTIPNPTATISESTEYTLTIKDGSGCEISETISILVDPCLGIENQALNENLRIYPNPSSGRIAISGLPLDIGEVEITVLNNIGREVISQYEADGSNVEINIDLNSYGLPKGIYFVRISTRSGLIIQKVQFI